MNGSKNKWSVRWEPGSQNYTIYNGEVAAYTGYDSKLEADKDLEKLIKDDEPAAREDFEQFFRAMYGELGKVD